MMMGRPDMQARSFEAGFVPGKTACEECAAIRRRDSRHAKRVIRGAGIDPG
jgi:hypothetical protein